MKEQRINGVFLIILGVLALGWQFLDFDWAGWMVVPVIGLCFLVWGVLTRSEGLIIPGGIMSGIGLGLFLMMSLPVEGAGEGGLFMLGFAGGWVLIVVMTAIFTNETQWWALIPALVMGMIALLTFGATWVTGVFAILGQLWPLILVGVGIALIIKAKDKEPITTLKEKSPQDLLK